MRTLTALLLLTAATPIIAADLSEAREAAKKFTLPPGFTVEAVAAEPLLRNPVAFSIDEAGRFWIAETHRLDHSVFDITKQTNWLRDDLTLKTVAERAAFMRRTFATNEALLTEKSERLVVVADSNGDGELDRTEVGGPFNKVESGLAAGVLARQGQVFFTSIPDLWSFDVRGIATNALATAKGRVLSTGYGVHIGVTGHDLHGLAIGMDGKLYFSVGDRGFNLGPGREFTETGGVLRCDLDGTNLEVVAIGLRNPQELAFDDLGNLWTADNDTAGEDKCRLIHVIEGADYGWRFSYQHMPGFGPWVQERLWEGNLDGTLPTAGEPAQGPSGLTFYPGTGLPAEYDRTFFLCDFPGGIQTFKVQPRGASYEMTDKKRFLWNAWPTDVEFGPDGFLHFTDWVAGWTTPAKGRIYRVKSPGVEPQKLDLNFEGKQTKALVEMLYSRDLRVRQGAHLEIARRLPAESQTLTSQLLNVFNDRAATRQTRLHVVWALHLANFHFSLKFAEEDPEVLAAMIKGSGGRNDQSELLPFLKHPHPRVRFAAAIEIAKFPSDDAAEEIIEMLQANGDSDPFLTFAGAKMLEQRRHVRKLAREHPVVSVRRAALLAARAMRLPEVAEFLNDPSEGIVIEAARAIYDVPISSELPKLAALLDGDCSKGVIKRAINASFRFGGSEAARRLAKLAARTNASPEARIEALECLAQWTNPDEVDRVVGLWRPIEKRQNSADAREALDPQLDTLLTDTNEAIASAALQALSTLRKRDFPTALAKALAHPATSMRVKALSLVDEGAPEATVARAAELASSSDLRLAQAAFAALGRVKFTGLKDRLASVDYTRPEIRLDIIEAAAGISTLTNAAAAKRRDSYLLVGGDPIAGKKIFDERVDLTCTRCHVVKGVGGTVGPALDGIGRKHDRAYLLESIVHPNKTIAKGFEVATILLKDGSSVVGTVLSETDEAIELNSPEDGRVTVRKSDIRARQAALSAMPEGLGSMLTPLELRDLVEYLASLK